MCNIYLDILNFCLSTFLLDNAFSLLNSYTFAFVPLYCHPCAISTSMYETFGSLLLDNAFSLTHFISLVVSFILTLTVHVYLISLFATNKYVLSNSLIILTWLLDFIISFLFQILSHLFVSVEWIELDCVVLVCLNSLSFVFMFDLLLWNDCWCIVWLLSIMASVS
jgi:hypothetical protein